MAPFELEMIFQRSGRTVMFCISFPHLVWIDVLHHFLGAPALYIPARRHMMTLALLECHLGHTVLQDLGFLVESGLTLCGCCFTGLEVPKKRSLQRW